MSLEAILSAGRAEFNHRALLARKARPSLEMDSLVRVLKEGLAPLVEACEAARPEKASLVASEGYDLALRLAALGPGRGGFLESVLALWRSLARRPADWCDQPGSSLGRTTNALLFLRQQDGFRQQDWIEGVGSPLAEGSSLEARGTFLGWTCGFAPLRDAALSCAPILPDALLALALGCPQPRPVLEGLASDPWWSHEPSGPAVAWKLGGFEGSEGVFPEPPICMVCGGRLVVVSGPRRYRLYADRFGAQLLAAGDASSAVPDAGATVSHRWSIEGLVTSRGTVPVPFPEGQRAVCEAGGVVVVSSPLSFWLLVVAP